MYRIGFQTIAWGVNLRDLDRAFEALSLAGYSGVEFSQTPSTIGDGQAEGLKSGLSRHNLQLLGLSGGSLASRIDFCGDILSPQYLYIEQLGREERQALATSDHTLALHLHVFKHSKPQRLMEARTLLNENPKLKWIPDTAHQVIAGEDPLQALRLIGANRLACIHLKDWSSLYGRTSHRYSKGFCELGHGEVPLERIIAAIKSDLQQSWIVVEQDYTLDDPVDCLYRSAMWIYDHGLLHEKPRYKRHTPILFTYPTIPSERELSFRRALRSVRAGEPSAFHNDLAEAFHTLIPSENISVWSCSSNGGVLILRGFWPHTLDISRVAIRTSETLSSLAIQSQQLVCFDLTRPHPAAHLGSADLSLAAAELITNDRCRCLLSIPVFSTFNPNHERMLVVALRNFAVSRAEARDVMALASEAGHLADHVLDERCT